MHLMTNHPKHILAIVAVLMVAVAVGLIRVKGKSGQELWGINWKKASREAQILEGEEGRRETRWKSIRYLRSIRLGHFDQYRSLRFSIAYRMLRITYDENRHNGLTKAVDTGAEKTMRFSERMTKFGLL
jgi:hypothetical protein